MRAAVRSLALAYAVVIAMAAQAIAAPIVNVYYNATTGKLTLQNTTASAVNLESFQVLTIGSGDVGPAAPGGQGYLTGSAALFPTPTPSFTTSNTSSGGVNGLFSEIFAGNVGSTALTLAAYPGWDESNPLGPAGSFFNLGDVAALGMTQADLNNRFITVPDFSPGGVTGAGQFWFTYETSPGDFSGGTLGDVVAVVPEPGSLALAGIGCGLVAWLTMRRRNCRYLSKWAFGPSAEQAIVPAGNDQPRMAICTRGNVGCGFSGSWRA